MTSKVAKLQRACLRNPVKVEVAAKNTTVATLRQEYMFVPAKYKDCYLVFLLTGAGMAVFTCGWGGGVLHASDGSKEWERVGLEGASARPGCRC